MPFDTKLLEILACPVCKGKLTPTKNKDALVCRFDRLRFPIIDSIPVLIETEAQSISNEELSELE